MGPLSFCGAMVIMTVAVPVRGGVASSTANTYRKIEVYYDCNQNLCSWLLSILLLIGYIKLPRRRIPCDWLEGHNPLPAQV